MIFEKAANRLKNGNGGCITKAWTRLSQNTCEKERDIMDDKADSREDKKTKIDDIKKYLDYIDQCVASHSFEDIPDQISCIRDELEKLEKDAT
jgi:archaellum component FlaC